MKHFIKLLALVSIVSFSLSCSTENDTERDTSIEIKNLKEEATILAKEYGVGIYINEDVWAQKTPSIEDIERTIVKHKSLAHTTKAPIYSNLEKPISKTAVNGGNDDLAYKPKLIKTRTEEDETFPMSGSFNSESDFRFYQDSIVTTAVQWTCGGPSLPDDVEVSALLKNKRTLEEKNLRVAGLTYSFHGEVPNFSAWFDLFREGVYSGRPIARAAISYDHEFGVGSLILSYDFSL